MIIQRMLPPIRLVLAASCALVLGCGSAGPDMFHVSGTVTFDGKPIPAGRIDFVPDLAKKNDGPQGFAVISDGKFDTRKDGQGHAGGPMVVRIEGFDGKADQSKADDKKPKGVGNPLFNAFELTRDLPKAASEQTFDVPASAATKAPVSKANPKS
jgi:hypothetical protein